MVRENSKYIGPWCNGNTTVFGAVVTGSNPVGPTFVEHKFYSFRFLVIFLVLLFVRIVKLFGLACTKAGEVPLQGTCGEFDSLRVHICKNVINIGARMVLNGPIGSIGILIICQNSKWMIVESFVD